MKKKIFVCEDESPIAKLISHRLKADGFDAEIFSDGTELLETLKTRKPDLLLLDIMLPGLDGISILRAIKGDQELAGIKVIMLTALSREADIVSCLDTGADDYITKPFSPSELSSRIRKILK